MIPYTTPYHRFKLPLDIDSVDKVYMTYVQDELVLFEKSLEDAEILDDNYIRVLLKQEETGMINECGHKVEVQMTCLSKDGKRLTSKPRKLVTGVAFKKEVI